MSEPGASNFYWKQGRVSRSDRERLNGHRGFTLWFTGISASGKSTLAVATEKALHDRGCRTFILDGDNIRQGLHKDLGFSPEDRAENIRRIGELAALFRTAGVINLVAFISPYRRDRQAARFLSNNDGTFVEIFVDCPLKRCEQRDPKGLYKKARQGHIKDFTGISAPYEPPENPEIHLRTDQLPPEACVQTILRYLEEHGLIAPPCNHSG